MKTWIKREHTIAGQKRALFTGEGAYHGSTKQKPSPAALPRPNPVAEARPTTLERYLKDSTQKIELFEAVFPNRLQQVTQLEVPSQEAIRTDGVTFCWCPFDEALREAGPVTKNVLANMQPHLSSRKRFVYIDSKIQYFEIGDLPVDSCLWHVDGSIAVRDERVLRFGASVLHDLRARFENEEPPLYLAYQSSQNSATGFLDKPLPLHVPELVPDFNGFDSEVRRAPISEFSHPAAAILAYDGLTIHRATPANAPGWRLWLRCTQTDVEIIPSESIIECYGTVFRPSR